MTSWPQLPTNKPFSMTGPALEEQLQQAFSPWGKATGLVSDETGLLVAFEGGIQIKFIPASVQFG